MSYVIGIYTTRPLLKQAIRNAESALRTAESLYVLARAHVAHREEDLEWLKPHYATLFKGYREVSLLQHHDAITGTSKGGVIGDYSNRINRMKDALTASSRSMIPHLLRTDVKSPSPSLIAADAVLTVLDVLPVVVFNQIDRERDIIVKLTLNHADVIVNDHKGAVIQSEVHETVDDYYSTTPSTNYALYFIAHVGPYQAMTYYLHKSSDVKVIKPVYVCSEQTSQGCEPFSDSFHLDNPLYVINLNKESLLPSSVTYRNVSQPFTTSFFEYKTSRSGVYIHVICHT